MMKFVCFLRCFALLLLFVMNNSAKGEFICSSEVSYKWVKSQPVAGGTPASAPPASTTPVEPSTVRFGGVDRRGADEAAAKEALEVELSRLKARASEACRKDHEAFGGCVGVKFSSNRATLQALDFSARKELEKSLTEECRGQQGVCTAVVSSEAKCREKVEAVPSPAAAEKEKKGEGKKK